MEGILYSITESAHSLSSLDFSRPTHFTNAALRRQQVTSLIRDADTDETKVLTLDRSNHVVLRSGEGMTQTKPSADEDGIAICAELERLVKI
ncbi:hypothetical protein V1512DRAFT_245551 [Lipomyces arxii]|uniref:uncharacterized protein n=1 Tax=Lipomyces arxii TaxID=56418 RepID=UPI0034CD726B